MTTSSAAGIAWDLRDLYDGVADPRVSHDLEAALAQDQAVERTYRGKIAALDETGAAALLAAVQELESLYELMDKPAVYASLIHAAQSDVPSHGALLSKTREQGTAINKHLIFFDLEWIKVTDGVTGALLADRRLGKYRHYLEQKRVWKPHRLSEGEEKVLEEKMITGKAAFGRLFEETTASSQFTYVEAGQVKALSMSEVLAKLYDPDRGVRRAAADSITKGLQGQARLLTFIFNNIVLDHDSDCRLR